MGRSRDNWRTRIRKVKNIESLPRDTIRSIWNRYSRGQSPETIYKHLKREHQLSASLLTFIVYIEKEVKPCCYEEHLENAKARQKRKVDGARLWRRLERSGVNPEEMYGGILRRR